MWKPNLSHRVAAPTVLVSLVLLSLCVAAALILYFQQLTSADVLTENVTSAQAAHDLETSLKDLVGLLHDHNDQVASLHERITDHFERVRRLADKKQEQVLVGRLDACLKRYFAHWERRQENGAAKNLEKALRILEHEALPLCVELQHFNAAEVRASESAHRATVRWMVLGLVAVGTVGSFTGLMLGYGVARGLRHSIYHLSVRVQDAANKLGQDLPPVALAETADLHHVHEQMKGVVSEIEQVVRKLQQREREVLRAEQLAAVGQLAAGVAHELRNPLTSIKMLVQTTREELAAQGLSAEDLHVIELEIRRMERCLQTFIDFARPPKPSCRLADVAEPVRRTVELVGGRARKQQVAVTFTPPPPPVVVNVDVDQIQQLLVNLALNALDVMPRGGRLEFSVTVPEPEQVEVQVRDTGPGLSDELLTRLFKPFVSSKETGLGLGLVISQRIAETHGGSLRAGNHPGGGARFCLRLPTAVGEVVRQ
jgi:C4-dicarboxylate-specific signal transduction histidine kinase